MQRILSIAESYINPRLLLVPLSSVLRQQVVDLKHVKIHRDWLVFGVRVLRFQLNLIGK